jgi:uncharacterized protein DUF732
MKHFVKSAGSVAAGLTAAALICAPFAAASPADTFVDALTDQGVTWPGATPANMVAAGQGVCQDWASGASFAQEVSSLSEHLDAEDAAFLVGAATAAFCPQYESKVK